MSYDISFKVKVEGKDSYVEVGNCNANTTWNVREMIEKSTGLEWNNCCDNGFCKDIIPAIQKGYSELTKNPLKYKQYEAKNGWGTVETTARFFKEIIESWEHFVRWEGENIWDVTTFWIE